MNPAKALSLLGLAKDDATPEPEGRVIELFRNRAELKKAYGSLQDEIHRLKDRLKQQEGATARVQEMLEALETRLAAPETGYPALAFYHLRGLWDVGRSLLAQFVADLTKQQEEKERKLHFAECNRRQFARRQALEASLRDAETVVVDARTRLHEAENELAGLTRFWHYFRRREATHRVHLLQGGLASTELELGEARATFEALEQEQSAEFPGLSLDARRAINVAAIAYAEVLCVRLARSSLVSQAKDAAARREVSDDYGDRAECESLMADIDRAKVVLQQRGTLSQDIRVRVDRLRQLAKYRHPSDTVPTVDSVGFAEGDILDQQPSGASALKLPNVLAEDTWDLFRVLLR